MLPPSSTPFPRLPAARAGQLFHEVGEIYAAVDGAHPEMHMMASVARVVPCYTAVLNAITLHPNRLVSWSSLRAEARENAGDAVIDRHLHQHPTLGRLTAAASHEAVRLSDVASSTELRRNPFVAGYYRPNGLKTQITFSVGQAETVQEGGVWVVGINRLEGGEFTAEDVACSNALRPHLERAIAMLRARRRREAALATREGAAESADCGTVAVDVLGGLVEATPTGRRLLAKWFGWREGAERLPAEILGRLAAGFASAAAPGEARTVKWTQTDASGARLSVHCRWTAAAEGLAGLWLRETQPAAEAAIAEALGLTPRQAAIARWIGEGKTNPEIGLLLNISPRTVDKHVEQMLARLGVENRAAIVRTVRDLAL